MRSIAIINLPHRFCLKYSSGSSFSSLLGTPLNTSLRANGRNLAQISPATNFRQTIQGVFTWQGVIVSRMKFPVLLCLRNCRHAPRWKAPPGMTCIEGVFPPPVTARAPPELAIKFMAKTKRNFAPNSAVVNGDGHRPAEMSRGRCFLQINTGNVALSALSEPKGKLEVFNPCSKNRCFERKV